MPERNTQRWVAWLSRLVGIPGLVAGLVAAIDSLASILVKAWGAALGLPLPYQLALASALGLGVLCAGGLLLPPLARRIPHGVPRVGLRLQPRIDAGEDEDRWWLRVDVFNKHRSADGGFRAELVSLLAEPRDVGFTPMTVGWRGTTGQLQRIGPREAHDLTVLDISVPDRTTGLV